MARFPRSPKARPRASGALADQPLPLLARAPGLGFVLAVWGGLFFVLLALNVRRRGPLLAWDVPASELLHRRQVRQSPRLVALIRLISAVGRELATLVAALLALRWLRLRRWRPLTLLTVGFLGANTWFLVLSRFFRRARPAFPNWVQSVPGPGFPSGHSLTSVTLYGLLLYLAWPRLRTARARRLAAGATALGVLGVGASRLYLGAHYLTDVLAGYSFGLFWAALTYTGLDTYFAHRR